MRLRSHKSRSAFTLVELMVAAALSLVIMTIMALAFQSAMGTLSNLKSMGDQADRLRTAEVMLRADLDSDHIVGDDGGSTVKISDLRFDLTATKGAPVIKGGYFSVITDAGSNEGNDSDGIPSTRMGGLAHQITMTVRRNSKTPADLFGTTNGTIGKVSDTLGTNDNSPWAEVQWTLNPTFKLTAGGATMYSLHRVVRPLGAGLPPTKPRVEFNNGIFNPDPNGDDIVLTNVLSFEVKPLVMVLDPTTNTSEIADSIGNIAGQQRAVQTGVDKPYSDKYWNSYGGVPNALPANSTPARLVAVLIKIRLYDIKTKLTRQMSLIVKV